MAVAKRGKKYYWMVFMVGGRRYQRSTGCTSRREAEEYERAFRTQLAKGEVGFEEKKPIPSFKAAMKEYLARFSADHGQQSNTRHRALTSSKALLRFFGDKPLDKITVEEVERFKDQRRKEKKLSPHKQLKKNKRAKTNQTIRPATVNRELACLKALFNHFIKQDVLTKNPVSRVKFLREDNEQMRVVTVDEERRYLLACNQPLRDVATLMIETGMRPEEIYRLERKNVFLDKKYLLNPHGKTKASRRKLPLTQRAIDVLSRRLKHFDNQFIFPSTRQGKNPSNHIVKLNNAHLGAIKRSGVEFFRLYDLRHTFATRAAEAGVDIMTLAALLGHSRIQMVLRYAHPSEEHQFAAIQKLQQYVGGTEANYGNL